MSEPQLTIYASVATIGDTFVENYSPGFARLQLTQEHVQRISTLRDAANDLAVSEIRDGLRGPFVEWFGGSGTDADCVEMVVDRESVYWTALPPGAGAPFQTPEIPINTLVAWSLGQNTEVDEMAVVDDDSRETIDDIKAMYQDHKGEQSATLSM